MEHQGLLQAGNGSLLKPSSRELMAEARQARAEALRSVMSGLGRRLRSIVASHLLSAREPIAGDASPSELKSRPGT